MKTMEEDEACDIAEFGVLRVSCSSDDKEVRACSKPVDGSCSNKPLFLEGELVFDPQTVSETHYADMRLYWLRTRAYTHSYVWNKIYRRWLFQDVRYPVGRVFEDMFTLPQLLLRAKRLRIMPHGCYIYHINSSGITAHADHDASMYGMLLTASLDAWRVLDIDTAPSAMRELQDLYYMHILNIQIDYYRLACNKGVVLPMRCVVPWRLSHRFVLKAFALHLLGVEGVCKLFSFLKPKGLYKNKRFF